MLSIMHMKNRIICNIVLYMCCMMNAHVHAIGDSMNIRYEVHRGPIDEPYLPRLKEFDATLFREYPYLFIPTPEHEAWYWHALSTPSTILVLAYDGETIVGALVGIATEENLGHGRTLSKHASFSEEHSFYLPWVAVDAAYQHQGIGRSLLSECERAAHEQGYTQMYLATVMRSKRHPFKPHEAFDPDNIWRRQGYIPAQLYEVWMWPTRVGVPGNEIIASVDNMVQFWHKAL
jgi:ribosomal protein S18 acetylase RimI-like enzyme